MRVFLFLFLLPFALGQGPSPPPDCTLNVESLEDCLLISECTCWVCQDANDTYLGCSNTAADCPSGTKNATLTAAWNKDFCDNWLTVGTVLAYIVMAMGALGCLCLVYLFGRCFWEQCCDPCRRCRGRGPRLLHGTVANYASILHPPPPPHFHVQRMSALEVEGGSLRESPSFDSLDSESSLDSSAPATSSDDDEGTEPSAHTVADQVRAWRNRFF